MGRKHEAVGLLKQGPSPRKIAEEMGVTISTVMSYLCTQVGEGAIQRSDIVFSFPKRFRDAVEEALSSGRSQKRSAVQARMAKLGIDVDAEELYLYLKLRNAKVEFGDLYESIRFIEVHLHSLARKLLEASYGPKWWWRLPLDVRRACANLHSEIGMNLAEPYCCTDFIHLKKIYDYLWGELCRGLPEDFRKHKKRFLDDLDFINEVRNAVMHPVKGLSLTDESFSRVRAFQRLLERRDSTPVQTWQELLSAPVASKNVQ
jgi:hypothetical protein